MTRSSRPTITSVLNFSKQLELLCEQYGMKGWFAPNNSIRQISLSEIPHLPKSLIRSGSFAISFMDNRPQGRPYRQAEWYIALFEIENLSDTLESEFMSKMLQFTFNGQNQP